MQLQLAVSNVFTQLSLSLDQLTPEQYIQPCSNLSDSTIGQHVRHIVEMFQCLEIGYTTGVVNYENRKRDKAIETDKYMAVELLDMINRGLGKADRSLVLEGVYHDDSTELMQFETNYYREIVYNLEHTIHHMALIRVGLKELKDLELPESFGLASATIKHKKSCAQ
ncbi:MAG TPA: hypothetical protein VK166_08980 [Chitinophagaceae bacterium]|nr:hypothetical protein [Chitinophagaceae bacterium]